MANTSTGSLVFINSEGPALSKDRKTSRQVRSHAVATALALKRRKAEQRGQNFRIQLVNADGSLIREPQGVPAPSRHLNPSSVDPFETLSIDAKRLTSLMQTRCSRRAGEPVFVTSGSTDYQSLKLVFGTGLTDGALTAALGLIMSLACTGGRFNQECMTFSAVALQQTRKKLSDPETAATPATIGTILLFLGVEYRTGARETASAHLQGLQSLMRLCEKKNVLLPEPLRRAIFWQDLFSSIFLGTARIVDKSFLYPDVHAPGLHLRPFIHTPKGFGQGAARLGVGFMSLVPEVAALYHPGAKWFDVKSRQVLEQISNTQADLEGRLHDLRQVTTDDMIISCIIAAYLCVYAFSTGVWSSPLIPRCLSKQLMHYVRQWRRDKRQQDQDLLFWVLQIGKAFAVDADVRQDLESLEAGEGLCVTDEELTKEKLAEFIWAAKFFSPEHGWFWEQIANP